MYRWVEVFGLVDRESLSVGGGKFFRFYFVGDVEREGSGEGIF